MPDTPPDATLRLDRMEGPEIEPIVLSGVEPIVLGRSHGCGVCLANPGVSRRHASLELRGGEWHVTDLESRHGTYLNTVRLAANTPTRVRHQDFITIAPWAFFALYGEPGADSGYRSTGSTTIDSVADEDRATITLRLGTDGSIPCELDRTGFYTRYATVIAGFARNAGASPGDAVEVERAVSAAFFQGARALAFDPTKGHFRVFLRRETLKALRACCSRGDDPPIDVDHLEQDVDATAAVWNWHWTQSLLRRAIDETRPRFDATTWEAFHRFGRQGEAPERVAADLGRSAEELLQVTEEVSLALREVVERIRGEEG